MIAYKGFHPGLVCRNYQFQMGLNVTAEANCAENGFHCAENPLDCLNYYSDIRQSEYYLVRPSGDIDEDAIDSKIACAELTIIKKLKKEEFFLHALAYMVDHSGRKWSTQVQRDLATAASGYAVVRGADPLASGKRGDLLAFAKEDPETRTIVQIALTRVDGKKLRPNTWYDVNLMERSVTEHG